MIKKFKLYESSPAIIGIVGIPSGEYLEITTQQFEILNEAEMLIYHPRLRCMTFQDADYHNIMYYIKDNQKDKIIKFLNVIGLRKYKINDDYTVDALESVKIRMPLATIPVKFDYVMGDFDASSCGLVNLKGCPDVVEGNFICTNNRLGSLKGGPSVVGGNYDVRQSGLNDLAGAPEKIQKDFMASYNSMPDLIGGPKIVNGSYYVDNCLLVSLEGSPDLLVGNFDCSFNLLDDLKDGPDMIGGTYDCSNNDIKTLKNGPASVPIFKCNGNRKLRDLHLAPYGAKIISDEL